MKTQLRLIMGDKKPKEEWTRYFISAYVTETRLMGAMGMYIHWRAADGDDTADFHQFFYFETEEDGFENYHGIWTDDELIVLSMEKENMGGLGGRKVKLTLTEASHILRHFIEFNQAHKLALPKGSEEYLQLVAGLAPLSPAAEQQLLSKQCVTIQTDYGLVNYFLMRSFGKDFEAAAFLAASDCPLDVYPEIGIATLCRNHVTQRDGYYVSESLIEHDSRYEIVVTEMRLLDKQVQQCRKTSSLKVSATEAALILSRPEYVTVYRMPDEEEDEFEDTTVTLDFDSVSEIYEDGKLFFSFYKNNEHVEQPIFRLSGDVYGVYYLTEFGQFLLMSYDEEGIRRLEREIVESNMGANLLLTDRYEFKEPILYEFIQSGFEDFNDFVRAVRRDKD